MEPLPDRRVRPHHRLRDADAEGPDPGPRREGRSDGGRGAPRRTLGAAAELLQQGHRGLTRHVARTVQRRRTAGAVIVAGDLNSTYDMLPFRRLLADGYRDAAEQAGAGLSRTYPSRPWRRPMIGIDHVLLCNCAATSAPTVAVPGSDHRGLATIIDLPVGSP